MTNTAKQPAALSRLAAATAFASIVIGAAGSAHADEALADLVEQVAPSVVTVLARQDVQSSTDGGAMKRFQIPEGTPFEEFFRNFGPGQAFPEQFSNNQPREGLGSGFILDPEGWLVTNHHVVDGAQSVTVQLSDGRSFDAEIVGVDEKTDLALLRIQADEALPYVRLGDSDEIRVGEDVMAVGNPFGLGGTVTAGIVSAKGRNISGGPYAEFLQTDAAINKGNSGGPLFNMDGEVVGVNSAIYSPTGGSVGVGFAVTSNIVEMIVEDLKEDGTVDRGWLGVSIQDVTPDLAEALGLAEAKGALVSSVVPGSPSDGILRAGDIILSFAGDEVVDSRALPKLVAATREGTEAELGLHRDGGREMVKISIGELRNAENEVPADAAKEKLSSLDSFGATVANLDQATRERMGLAEDASGVVVTALDENGPAAKAGVRVGDVIVRVGDREVKETAEVTEAIAAGGSKPSLLLVNRGGQQLFIAVAAA